MAIHNTIFWHSLVDGIHQRPSNWKSKNMSIGGRLVLTKYVLSSLPLLGK